MRILVLQLARFGDIYQTWPTLKGLQRSYPGAEIHVLVRERFKAALDGLPGVQVHAYPTVRILDPIFQNGDESAAHEILKNFMAELCSTGFDKIVNLSFSPLSSFLTDMLASETAEVSGYTRTADGFLRIPDDTSAYFYAQAHLGGLNRFHITEIFAAIAGVELTESDFQALATQQKERQGIAIHLGASQTQRVYPAERWIEALTKLSQLSKEPLILVGSSDERGLAEAVVRHCPAAKMTNHVGQTQLFDLMQMLTSVKLLIAADSAPAQMASLTQTPVLNLTSDESNFWTTGPTSAGSVIIYAPDLHAIGPQRIADESAQILRGHSPMGPAAVRRSQLEPYENCGLASHHFSWALLDALYTNADFPTTEDQEDLLAFQRLNELAELALQQLEGWEADPAHVSTLLASTDLLISQVGKLNRNAGLIVQWFETERLRIGPFAKELVYNRTCQLLQDLRTITSVYHRYQDPVDERQNAVSLCKTLSPALRECDFASVQNDFQTLLSTLHELARHSTKVGTQDWSDVLAELGEAMRRRDFIDVADQLEYVLVPALS